MIWRAGNLIVARASLVARSIPGTCAMTAAISGSSAATTITCPPPSEVPHNAIRAGIDSLGAACKIGGGANIFTLPLHVNQLAGLSLTLAETAIVECQNREASDRKPLGI